MPFCLINLLALAQNFEALADGAPHGRVAASYDRRRLEEVGRLEVGKDPDRTESEDGDLDPLHCHPIGHQLVLECDEAVVELADGTPCIEPEESRSRRQGQRGSGFSANSAGKNGT